MEIKNKTELKPNLVIFKHKFTKNYTKMKNIKIKDLQKVIINNN